MQKIENESIHVFIRYHKVKHLTHLLFNVQVIHKISIVDGSSRRKLGAKGYSIQQKANHSPLQTKTGMEVYLPSDFKQEFLTFRFVDLSFFSLAL